MWRRRLATGGNRHGLEGSEGNYRAVSRQSGPEAETLKSKRFYNDKGCSGFKTSGNKRAVHSENLRQTIADN